MTDNTNAVQPQATISDKTKNVMLIVWIASFFFSYVSFIPALIAYLLKKDDAEAREETRKALNASIFSTVIFVVSFVLCFVIVGFLGILFWLVYFFGNFIVGLIACCNNKAYKPWIYAPNWVK